MFSSKPIDRTSYLGGKDALLLLLTGSKCIWKQYISAKDLVLGASAKNISNLCAPNESTCLSSDIIICHKVESSSLKRPSLNLR